MTASQKILDLILELAFDDDDANAEHVLPPLTTAYARALEAELEDEDRGDAPEGEHLDANVEQGWLVYCKAYNGRTSSLAERREVSVPDWLTGWQPRKLLETVARADRLHGDAVARMLQAMAREHAGR